MQSAPERKSNRERTEATRALLIDAARTLFVQKGYADTGTPEIVAAAGVTRGALYHHFADKQALLRAVVERESRSVADEIDRAAPADLAPVDALVAGGEAFVSAMAKPGRTRLLLLDGPAVLGRGEMDAIDLAMGAMRSLRVGLALAMRAGEIGPLPLDALTAILSAAFDRAALAIESGGEAADHRAVLSALIRGLTAESAANGAT